MSVDVPVKPTTPKMVVPRRPPGGRALRAMARGLSAVGVVPPLVLAAVVVLAVNGGAYALEVRAPVAIALWWTAALAVAVGLWRVDRVPRAAVVSGGLLAALALLAVASAGWSDSAQRALEDANRVLLYLGVFSVVVLAAARGSAQRWRDGLAGGIATVAVLALLSRLFPGFLGEQGGIPVDYPGDVTFLSWPLDYWNGVGIFAALGIPLLLGVAVGAQRSGVRALGLAALPAVAGTLFLTSSRGGVATALAGTLLFVALTDRRWIALQVSATALAGSAAVIAVLSARPLVLDGPFTTAAAASQGRSAALLIALVLAATALVSPAIGRLPGPPAIGRRGRWALGIAALALVGAAVVAADPVERFDAFRQPPSNPALAAPAEPSGGGSGEASSRTSSHLASKAGHGRWQFWSAAVDQFEERPLLGHGAGSYEAWWAQNGSISYFTRRAHSLYLETMGELGVIGLLLLVGLVGSAVAPLIRRLRAAGEQRPVVASLGAGFFAFALAAGIDWMWELTLVGMAGIALLALLVGPATLRRDAPTRSEAPRSRRRRNFVLGGAVVASAMTAIVAQGIPLLVEREISSSQQAAARGDLPRALADAQDARRLQPWAASPHLQVALVHEQAQAFGAARAAISEAISNDPTDWRLWLVSARIAEAAGEGVLARRHLARAVSLNPRSPLFATLPYPPTRTGGS